MTPDAALRESLPEPVRRTLDEFRESFGLDIRLWSRAVVGKPVLVYPSGDVPASQRGTPSCSVRTLIPRDGPPLDLEVDGGDAALRESVSRVLCSTLEQTFDFAQEIRFFTYEVSERYEEINLLYSISETLGSILDLDDAARIILQEVCDVLGARRGSLWVHDAPRSQLRLVASVGDGGLDGPLSVEDPRAVTSRVFREGRPIILIRGGEREGVPADPPPLDPIIAAADSVLSVPIRYSPLSGESRTVGVINLIGRAKGGRFSASDQKLLAAIASQVGAALENHRLIRESLAREGMAREMELAHHLQMKLLPQMASLQGLEVAGRVQPAEQVGGDFYHAMKLRGGKVGVMIGDVSGHGFPAALIMALAMSAVTIFAAEVENPGEVLRQVDRAIRDELESTEMYLTLFYGVLDPARGELVYASAGHPHAFVIRADGTAERLPTTDPPVGIVTPDEHHEARLRFAPSRDLLLLFTDGLSDLLAGSTRRSGEEVVVDHAATMRHETPETIVEGLFALVEQATPGIPSDDRTVLVLKG